jgi:hypothetical protein
LTVWNIGCYLGILDEVYYKLNEREEELLCQK